jgi:hypothetical protein
MRLIISLNIEIEAVMNEFEQKGIDEIEQKGILVVVFLAKLLIWTKSILNKKSWIRERF